MIEVLQFNELTVEEIYQIIGLRERIFVVEQGMSYQDADGIDRISHHVMMYDDDLKIFGYLRIIPGDYVHIGRVSVEKELRNMGYGTKLLERALKYIESLWPEKLIHLTSQVSATKVYENLGFVAYGEKFLIHGIPHIRMKKIK